MELRLGYYNSFFSSGTSCPDTGEAYAWFDDLYIDRTQARIEIGDNQVYEDCSHREIQIPTAWSTTEIKFTTNKGSFSNGQTVYIFVVDENGVASAGVPVTIN